MSRLDFLDSKLRCEPSVGSFVETDLVRVSAQSAEKQRCRILALQSRAMPSSRTATPKSAKLQVITADSFAGIEWLRHGFSTRKGGVSKCYGGKSLNLGLTEDDTRESVNANRELFFREIAADN